MAGRPNVIVLLVDDMGWKDLSCQGSGFYRTPHIDRLAASGVRFTSGYSAGDHARHPGGATPHSAIRAGDFRLVHFYEDGRNELYDLRTDPGETTDLAAADPARTLALKARLDAWLVDVGGQMPTANAAFDPVRDGKPSSATRKR